MKKKQVNLALFEFRGGKIFYDGEEKKTHLNSQGYTYSIIEGKSRRVHRLVAMKYVPNPDNKRVVDHIDGDKTNFHPSNLKWLTYSENQVKAYKENESMKFLSKENRVDKGKICSEKDGVITIHDSLRKCAKYLGRDVAAIYRVLQGEWNKCNGHQLRYIDISDIKEEYIKNPKKTYAESYK